MKELILIHLFQLINATDLHQRVALKDKIVTFISAAEFRADQASANCTRRLIINTLEDYVAAPTTVPVRILKHHYTMLAKTLA